MCKKDEVFKNEMEKFYLVKNFNFEIMILISRCK